MSADEEQQQRERADREAREKEAAEQAALPYKWTQTIGDLDIAVPLDGKLKARDLDVTIARTRIRVAVKGEAPILEVGTHGPPLFFLLNTDIPPQSCRARYSDPVEYLSVHSGIAKNKRQPYAVSEKAGEQTSAESWGTGRAVARIPRVSGGGTHRAGQAAFGNQCRAGRMFAPTKVWRRWQQKVNLKQKRFAVASSLAASSVSALLLARGHRVEKVPEVPLVIESKALEGLAKTKAAIALLKGVGAGPELEKVDKSRKIRAGHGKLRGRRYRQRRGPLVVYHPEADGKSVVKAFRNIPGVETSSVFALNLLQLAPGGHLGRFIVWSSAAFAALDQVYGSTTAPSAMKKDFLLPSNIVLNADIARLINSTEVQSALNAPKGFAVTKRVNVQKKNALVNKQVMLRLNPYAKAFAAEKIGQLKAPAEEPIRAGADFHKNLNEN
ncbi:hypothetical protein KEM52_000281 [Ascosphaera acerosa]|nr:hypothetical protein KEM52_000281 [Ascosphaera acerosa]